MDRAELIDAVAADMAEEINGGSWDNPDFYGEDHKELWRKRAEEGP